MAVFVRFVYDKSENPRVITWKLLKNPRLHVRNADLEKRKQCRWMPVSISTNAKSVRQY